MLQKITQEQKNTFKKLLTFESEIDMIIKSLTTTQQKRSLKTEQKPSEKNEIHDISSMFYFEQSNTFMESLILAQDERWRRA